MHYPMTYNDEARNTAMLKLHNTLTKTVEPFSPINASSVGMYNCGPTVYDRVHIGNLRPYVFADTLRRALEARGYNVTQVVNITDVGHLSSDADEGEDKMTKGLAREGLPMTLDGMKTLADRYTAVFEDDMRAMNIQSPHTMPRATETIPDQIALIKKLEEKGFVYVTGDGVYFDTSKDASYGKLGGLTPLENAQGRVEGDKKNPRDFALWKFNSELGWESPWGKGFPGWHIECSAMSMKYLGESFDIHTGGIDHIPVHHNNEIAQAENATGKPYARFWLHNAFVNIDGTKVSKSLRNTLTLADITDKGIAPLAYRYWLLTGHYRSELTFTWEALEAAQNAYDKLLARVRELPKGGAISETYKKQFDEAIDDDLGTPQAIAVMWDMLKDDTVSPADKRTTVGAFDDVLGLQLLDAREIEIPDAVRILAEKRETARANKEWNMADDLRKEVRDLGFDIKDGPRGPVISSL